MFRRFGFRFFAATNVALAQSTQGKVANWMHGKGYGFIEGPGDKKYFVHFKELNVEEGGYRSLSNGQEVQFEIFEEGPDKLKALNVRSADGGLLPGGPMPTPKPREEGDSPSRGGQDRDLGEGGSYRGRGGGQRYQQRDNQPQGDSFGRNQEQSDGQGYGGGRSDRSGRGRGGYQQREGGDNYQQGGRSGGRNYDDNRGHRQRDDDYQQGGRYQGGGGGGGGQGGGYRDGGRGGNRNQGQGGYRDGGRGGGGGGGYRNREW